MLQMFRNFFKSKFGVAVTLIFLGLIGFAFASSDVANTGTFGGITGGDRVAVVGDQRLSTSDLTVRTNDALTRLRQENPTMTMEAFVANNGLSDTLDVMVSRAAVAELAQQFGLRAGTRLVDSEIASNPNLRGLDGTFDAESFRNALRQQGISEDMFRSDLAMNLFTQMMARPAMIVPRLPASLARRYAQLNVETRSGNVAALLANAYAPDADPTDAQLQAFYTAKRDNYIRPERRVLRYATFGEDAFGNLPPPTEQQIADRFERDSLLYSERETRSFTQLIVPTQAAAQAIVNEVNGGVTLEASARSKGLSVSNLALTTKEDLAQSTSATVANAGFAAARGALSAPAQGQLGWYILRPDNVDHQAARPLAQVRGEIAAALTVEQRRQAMNDATARIDDEFGNGKSLSEVAQELGVEIKTTRALTAAGQIYGTQEGAAPELAPVLAAAFEMDEADPQLAEVVPGQTFMIYDVSDITRSAAAPLGEIRDQVIAAWKVDEGMKKAGEAARRVIQRMQDGSTMAAAVQAEDVRLPAPEAVRLSRAEIDRTRRVSRPIALFFSMAKGTIKSLEVSEAGAWFVVAVQDIITPEVSDTDQVVVNTGTQLTQLLPDEYGEQFINAAKKEVDVEINQVAVDAVEAQLTGRATN